MIHQSLLCILKLSTNNNRLFSCGCQIFRRLSTSPPRKPPSFRRDFNKHNLYTRLSSVWSTGEKLSDILDDFSKKQSKKFIIKHDLIHCIKKFRKFGRYDYCLEILEWMEKSEFRHNEYALRLIILCKVKGICEAEKYFDSLPSELKKGYMYGALLNCYCTEKMTDKAMALFEKMDEMKYTNDLAFSNLMCLYMKLDQPEKVLPLVEDMKRRNIPLSLISYQTWMLCYTRLDDIQGVERVMEEAERQEYIKDDWKWKLYCALASAYVKGGQYQKAVSSLKKVEEILGNSSYPDRFGYHHLISLYGGVGDLESVTRAWDDMKLKFPACNNLSYLAMLRTLSKLDKIEQVTKYFQEWNSNYKSYDLRLPTVVIGAYLRHDMLEEAELLLKDVTDRSGSKVWKPHVLFMNYFLKKRQIDSVLRHLEAVMANQWKPLAWSLDPFIEYFTEEKDFNGAEQFFNLIKKDQSLLSTAYLGLLQVYAAAGKTAPEMRERMEQDGAAIGTEHEKLLEKVCPL